jgi:signal transduction histidine kinase
VAFAVTALVVAMVLAALTFGLARSYLLDQREAAAERQAYVNARLARAALRADHPDVPGLLTNLSGGTASDAVLRYRDEWFSTSVSFASDSLPSDLVRTVTSGHAALQRFNGSDGTPRLAVGVPVAAADAYYFEQFGLDELDRSLALLTRALCFGVAGAAAAAAVVGRVAANRVVRPLGPVADAAERIAAGELDTRLTDVLDPDLRRLTDAFNEMAVALEARIDREARFAADVSHELRSPLTAVAAAVEIIDRRRDQLPPQVMEAFTVLREKIETFQQMVLDLLEISRMDAGTAVLADDVIDLEHLITRLLSRHGAGGLPVTFDADAPRVVTGDRRRLAQAIGNIVDNAASYAGGATRVIVREGGPGRVRVIVDDEGPGVAEAERAAIFGRFARGKVGVQSGAASGTGLGLSLVDEHVRLHGGRVWVEENDAGGARFVIELPVGAL